MVNTQTLYWAAGFLEGRGSTTLRAGRPAQRLRVGRERRDALDRLVAGFGGHVYAYRGGWRWQLSQTESIGVMMTLYPLMSPSRRAGGGGASWGGGGGGANFPKPNPLAS